MYKTKFSILIICFIILHLTIADHDEIFEESIKLKFLGNRKVLISWNFLLEQQLNVNHQDIFPKVIAQVADSTSIAEMHLSFGSGQWDYVRTPSVITSFTFSYIRSYFISCLSSGSMGIS